MRYTQIFFPTETQFEIPVPPELIGHTIRVTMSLLEQGDERKPDGQWHIEPDDPFESGPIEGPQ